MNELNIFSELHKFINALGPMSSTLAAKSMVLGYRPISFRGASPKFATLHGEKRYSCLVLHVDPGNKESAKGKTLQKQIQDILHFDIRELRTFQLKNNDIYVPFEVVDTKQKLLLLKDFVQAQYSLLY
jgi:hypothetical protein